MNTLEEFFNKHKIIEAINKDVSNRLKKESFFISRDGTYNADGTNCTFSSVNEDIFLDSNKSFIKSFNNIWNLIFEHSCIQNITSDQHVQNTLFIHGCQNIIDFDLSHVFFDRLNAHKNPELIIHSCTNLKKIYNLQYNTNKKLEISFNSSGIQEIVLPQHQSLARLCIQNCFDFKTTENISNGYIEYLTLANNRINHFTKHNANYIANCIFDASRITTFRNIEQFIISYGFKIKKTTCVNNIINVLFNKCEHIVFTEYGGVGDDIKNVVAQDIMNRYLLDDTTKMSKQEFVMDVAVELIVAGIPEGAEL